MKHDEMIVVALMLCHALGRDEAQEVLRQRDIESLDQEMTRIQELEVPDRLTGYGRYWRRNAWIDGRNDAIGELYRSQTQWKIKSRQFREASR